MTTFVLSDRSFREIVRVLREFEGLRCLWRAGLAATTYVLLRGLPVVAAVVIAVISVGGGVLGAAVSAVIALVFDGLGSKVRQHFPWRTPLESRLWTYEKPNPATEVQVILRSPDVRRARTVLRHARFNPAIYGVRLVRPPADAPDMELKIAVHEPEAWPQSASDADRTQRIARVLASAGIRGRANGVDAWPEGEATAQSGRIRPAALPRT